MKRQIMVTLLAGFSTAALAQSSVTLYGLVDAGVGKSNVDYGPHAQVRMLANSTMNNLNSRIGVRGVEDLGGRRKVGFTLENGIDLNDGSTQGPDFWARTAELWIGGAWGKFAMGRSYAPADSATFAWDVTGLANYNVTEGMFLDVGSDFRNSSQFSYTTPVLWGGLTSQIAYIAKDNRPDNQSKVDWNVIYANGPVHFAVDFNKVQHEKSNYGLGGMYDINSMLTVAAAFVNANHVEGGSLAANNLKRRGFTLGGRVDLGATSVSLSLGRDIKGWGPEGKKHTNGLLEVKYRLSKRTFMYAAYLNMNGTNNWGLGLQNKF